jgi:ABC-2 type transport system permease protein
MKVRKLVNHQNRALLRELVATDFKLRYQGSFLGYMWSLLRPIFLFAILLTVFGFVLKIGASIPHYPLYLLLGIVLWNFFVEATSNGLYSIVSRGDLLRKIKFPRYIVVISGTISALINLGISLLVVFVFMLFYGVLPTARIIWMPLLIAELYLFALALAFFLSAFYVKYRDISHIWDLLLQAAFYATPIIYPLSLVINKSPLLAKILLLNPMAQIIQDARYVLVSTQTTTLSSLTNSVWVFVPLAIIVVVAIIAARYFRANSGNFAENI